MGALRQEKLLGVPKYSSSCHRLCIASSLFLLGTPWLPPFLLHLPAPPLGLEVLALPEDKTEQRVMLGLKLIHTAHPLHVPTLQKELWEDAG